MAELLRWSYSSTPSSVQILYTLVTVLARLVKPRNRRSTASNWSLYVGSCYLMSSLEKINYRYIQFFCNVTHSSITSAMRRSSRSQPYTRSRTGAIKREAIIVCSSIWWSSNCCVMSSNSSRIKTLSRFLYGFVVNAILFQTCRISSRSLLIFHYPVASPLCSINTSLKLNMLCSCSARRFRPS